MTFENPHPELGGKYIKYGTAHLLKESAYIDYSGGLTLMDHSSIGERAMVYTHKHPTDLQFWQDLPVFATPLVIGEYACIGAAAIILGGVTRIGKYSFIGAGSVVTKPVPDMEIWAGNPARKIKDVQIHAEKEYWWNYLEKIKK
jgi:acetyltransferase-like isoleucine patch superfamily enzyme